MWASSKEEFDNIKSGRLLYNWEGSLLGGHLKTPKAVSWVPPRDNELKFNMDGAAGGKPEMADIGRVLCNNCRVVLAMFSKHVGILESNEVEVLVILEALRFD